jgi:hypothetical protein
MNDAIIAAIDTVRHDTPDLLRMLDQTRGKGV